MNYTVEKTNVQEFIKELRHYFRPALFELCHVDREKRFQVYGLLSIVVNILDSHGKSPIVLRDPDVFHFAQTLKEGLQLHWEPVFESNWLTLVPLVHPGIDMDTMSHPNKILSYLSPDFLKGLDKATITKLHFLLSLIKHYIDTPNVVFEAKIQLSIGDIVDIRDFFDPIQVDFTYPPSYKKTVYYYVEFHSPI
jgi:hypothetical protein